MAETHITAEDIVDALTDNCENSSYGICADECLKCAGSGKIPRTTGYAWVFWQLLDHVLGEALHAKRR